MAPARLTSKAQRVRGGSASGGANTQFHSLYLPQFAGGYELETQLLIQILTGANGVFFDVGANWGHLSVALAITEGFHGEIHAFEPAGDCFRDLYEITQQTSNSISVIVVSLNRRYVR